MMMNNIMMQKAFNLGESAFLQHFNLVNGLSEAERLPINLIQDNCCVGVYYSSKAYDELVRQITDLKHEVKVLKATK